MSEAIGVDGDCKIDLRRAHGNSWINPKITNAHSAMTAASKPGHMVFNMDSARTWSDALEFNKETN